MKQTNNAIKFLMAQYRAIFRNANLKMFLAAATAAAALSATQAQAADKDWANAHTVTASDALKASGSGSVAANTNEFDITLTQAGNEIKTTDNSGAATFTASKGSITLNGNGATLAIGSASASGATVDIKKFTNAQGTLTIQGSGATTSILKAGEIVLGTAPQTPAAKAAPKAIVELKDKGIIGDANKTTSLSIFDGGELKFAGAGAKAAASGEGVLLNGGKINVLSAATDAAINGKLTVSKGTVDIANSGGLTVDGLTTLTDGTVTVSGGANGGTLNLKGGLTQTKGTIDVKTDATKAGALNISGTTSVTGGEFKVGSGSTVKLEGDASFAKDTLKLDANGKLNLGKLTGDAKRTLTANSNDLKGALATNDSIEASGDATSTFVVELNDTESVDLAAVKLVQDAGTRGAGLKIKTAKYGLKGDKAAYKKGKFNDTTAYDFNTLEVGETKAFEITGGAKVTVHNAISDANGAALTTLKVSSGDLILSAAEGASGTVGAETLNLQGTAATDAKLILNNGNWTVQNLTLTKGTVNVSGGELSVAGTLNTKDDSVLDVTGGTVSTLGEGKIKFESNANSVKLGAGTYLKLDADDIFEKGKKTLDKTVFKQNAVSGDGSSVIVISGGEALTKTEFQQLLTDTGFKGVFDMNVNLEVPEGDLTIKDIQPNLQTDAYNAKTLKVETGEKISSALSVGNVKVNADTDLSIGQGGSLILNTADKTTGNFVSKKSGEAIVVGGVKFEDAKNSLTLKGTGNIGAITASAANQGTVVVGGDKVEGVVTVVSGNSLGETTNTLNQVSVNDGASLKVESGSVFANNITLEAGSSVTVNGDITSQSAQVDGVLNATGTLSLSAQKDHNFHSAEVNVGKLSLGSNVKLNIGQFDASVEENNHTATVYAGTLELKQGTVFIDPSYVKPHSSLVVGNLSGGTAGSAGSLDGKVVVAQNAALAVGFDSKAEFLDVISKYTQANGAFYETPEANTQQISNALVLNKPISLAATDGILVDATAKDATGVTANSVNIKDGAGLVITDEVYTVDPSTGAKNGNAITLANSGTADVSNSKLILIGDFSAADTNLGIFSNVTSVTGANTMMIQSANGLLQGTMAANGTVGITFDKAAAMKKGAFSDASYPVQQLLFTKLSGELKGNGLGFDLISDVATTAMSGAVADAAAHAATYAGAQQAAVAAVGSMAEAVGGRVGSMRVEAATISATGSQANGGVWLSPMYKSVDADGFNAEGASYGAEVDLAGVAFGTDTVNGNMRFGAVFNIGSGDADGKGNGNGLKDEFDYYGFGMYSVMGFGNFALVGDASLNVISHEVEGLGLKGSADTTAVTMGVTGQYTISNPAVDVTPHVGARFIRLDTDSYDLKSDDGVVASTDFDVQNVFSVPLGVTLSKAFEMGGWSLAPSADLSITFNTGDTEVNSTTQFTGVKAIGLTTEVLDEVTYGVAVGLGAQYGAFGTQIGINYTGSSNTDSFGVNAQARYMF